MIWLEACRLQQFASGGAPSTVTPIYSAALQYQLFKPTVLFATAARTLTPSYFGGLDTTATRPGQTNPATADKEIGINGPGRI